MKENHEYFCEVCNKKHYSKEDAIKCEEMGYPIPKFKLGDIINFMDCEETPREYNKIWEDTKYNKLWESAYAYHADRMISHIITDIEVCGHNIYYILDGGKFRQTYDFVNWVIYLRFNESEIEKIINSSYNKKGD